MPQDWPEASQAPHLNVLGIDPEFRDAENWDFRLKPGSPAQGYGCQSFPALMEQKETFPGLRRRGDSKRVQSLAATHEGRESDGRADAARSRAVPLVQERSAQSSSRSRLDVSGLISEDTAWSADTIRVVGPVTVGAGVTLSVMPGTHVEFQGLHDLNVEGRMLAEGTADLPILFTSADPGAFQPDSSTVGCWGGIGFEWTSSTNEESRFEHCVFECAKSLDSLGVGGALHVVGFSKLLVRNCVFRSNAAVYGGAVGCRHQAAPRFVGCLFEGNYAFVTGSCVYASYSYPDLVACTLAGNTVLNEEIFDPAGVVHNYISKTRATSSIVRGNVSNYFIPTQMVEAKTYYVTFSNVEDLREGLGNIDEDPQFVGFGAHPLAIRPGSPCEDAGRPDTLDLELAQLDLAGQPRVSGGRLDMGAYEGAAGAGVEGELERGSLQLTCFPNPCSAGTVLSMATTHAGRVHVAIHDVSGRLVRSLLREVDAPGPLDLRWDGRGEDGRRVACGVYFVRAAGPDGSEGVAKLVLMR